ncbi:DUF2703 domain-containing protein [Geomonas sp. RF6]|uniref:DUF2703 domain-containing protein n=1 Tax=Geomonas sp. RF6 TaxID=2897342 RepID=UPI001E5D2F91|nr:DUF2703 domain-containing protein [Geomonas sp. RF6]UFS70625.1 DUF2703 domain-containing protein [Geomonas sp. RF6]
MKDLRIEWLHYDEAGETCDRCSSTGSTLAKTVEDLRNELAAQGVTVTFVETLLEAPEISRSNMILLNGEALETLVDAEASASPCPSCSCLTGSETACRTVRCDGAEYEDIPEHLIRKAVAAALRR